MGERGVPLSAVWLRHKLGKEEKAVAVETARTLLRRTSHGQHPTVECILEEANASGKAKKRWYLVRWEEYHPARESWRIRGRGRGQPAGDVGAACTCDGDVSMGGAVRGGERSGEESGRGGGTGSGGSSTTASAVMQKRRSGSPPSSAGARKRMTNSIPCTRALAAPSSQQTSSSFGRPRVVCRREELKAVKGARAWAYGKSPSGLKLAAARERHALLEEELRNCQNNRNYHRKAAAEYAGELHAARQIEFDLRERLARATAELKACATRQTNRPQA
eukprot:798691-Pleurochrysis_carterae.AAC.5